MFGEYDVNGKRLQDGKIDFIEEPENPTGLDKYIKNYARQNGEFISESYYTTNDQGQRIAKSRITGYKENNPDKFTAIRE